MLALNKTRNPAPNPTIELTACAPAKADFPHMGHLYK
jgi:hypothetical protein